MAGPLSRRTFLASSCSVAAAAALIGSQEAKAAYGYRFSCDDEFKGEWLPWLKTAVGAASTMCSDAVVSNLKSFGRGYCNIDRGVWEKSNFAKCSMEYWRTPAFYGVPAAAP